MSVSSHATWSNAVLLYAAVGIVLGLGVLAMRGLSTEGRIQVVVVTAAASLLFWHLLHLLAGSSSH